jgi:hypothetical protein
VGAGLLRPHAAEAAYNQQPAGIDPLVWVWKFSADGPLPEIRDTLAANGLGIILKTHDGTTWMDAYDDSPDAISGPGQVGALAATFEQAGVGFHAWCVVKGEDPVREAQMCAEVLQAGARDLYLDLEPKSDDNYWQGSAADAVAFGEELRRLAPNAWIVVAPDARPWQAGHVPLAEFVAFSNAIAPQAYWETFQGPTNREKYAQHGYWVGPEGVTPELVIDASVGTFQGFGRPIYPIGQGASSPDKWQRFIASALSHGIGSISLWRYGASDRAAFRVLHDARSQPAPVAAVPEAPQPQVAPVNAPADAAATVPHVEGVQAPMSPVQVDLPDNELLHLEAAGQISAAPLAAPVESPALAPPEADAQNTTQVLRQAIDEMKSRVTSGLRDNFLDLLR